MPSNNQGFKSSADKASHQLNAKAIRQQHIEEIKKELIDLSKRNAVADNVQKLNPQKQYLQQPKHTDPANRSPNEIPPDELADMFALVIASVLGDIYVAVKLWSEMSTVSSVVVNAPMVISGYGCLHPKSIALPVDTLGEKSKPFPQWMKNFGTKVRSNLKSLVEQWIASVNLTGLPIFPAAVAVGAQSAPWPLSQVKTVNMTDSYIKSYLKQGAVIGELSVVDKWKGKRPDDAAVEYIAKQFLENWKFATYLSTLGQLFLTSGVSMPPGSPIIGGQAISACGVLGDFGRKLTDPAKFAGSAPMPETHVAAALREEIAIVTYGAKGAPSAPPLPS